MNQCQTLTLQEMKHHVKISQGVSEESFHHTSDKQVFGSGKGSGAGVPNWHSHNKTIIATYAEFHPGIDISTPDGRTTVNQNVMSFVDDNNLNDACKPTATTKEMHSQATQSLGSWQKIMTLTGGAVELPKCYLSFMAYNFNTYSLRQHGRQQGVSILKTVEELPGTCKWRDDDGKLVEVHKVQPNAGQRLLGVRFAADGNFCDEFVFRRDQAETQARWLQNSSASPQDAYMIYAFRYCPALFYCLHLTYFTQKECDKIHSYLNSA